MYPSFLHYRNDSLKGISIIPFFILSLLIPQYIFIILQLCKLFYKQEKDIF